jgi:hypothetical protein
VFAADRRISQGVKPHSEQIKILEVPHLIAGIGFFGLAGIPKNNRLVPMSDWLQEIVNNATNCKDLKQLATKLADSLNRVVPDNLKQTERSGFHIAGFNSQNQVEFWYVRNVDDDRRSFLGKYEAREEFQRRDTHNLPPDGIQIYRNGDIRAHVLTWEEIDESFGTLLNYPEFDQVSTPEEYIEWVRFKMETIALFYEKFCSISIIGRPVDVFTITLGEIK